MALQLVRAMFSKSSRRELYIVYDSYDNILIDPYRFEKNKNRVDQQAEEDANMGVYKDKSDKDKEQEDRDSTEVTRGGVDKQEQDEQRNAPRGRKTVRWEGEYE